MHQRTKLWIVVWIVLAVGGIAVYPGGRSTLLFGFWPSNHFIIMAMAFIVACVGLVFAYDYMYNINPPPAGLERGAGGLEIVGEEAED